MESLSQDLSQQKCLPCTGYIPELNSNEIATLKFQIPGWSVIEHRGILKLERAYKFRDYQTALDFTQQVGTMAEVEGHHPALLTEWGKVTVNWWTHAVDGLSQNDFIMAAKTDEMLIRNRC